jgi:hypothetical protein
VYLDEEIEEIRTSVPRLGDNTACQSPLSSANTARGWLPCIAPSTWLPVIPRWCIFIMQCISSVIPFVGARRAHSRAGALFSLFPSFLAGLATAKEGNQQADELSCRHGMLHG